MKTARRSFPTITFVTQDELKRLVATVKEKHDRAIILVAYRHGLCASEIGLLRNAVCCGSRFWRAGMNGTFMWQIVPSRGSECPSTWRYMVTSPF